MLGEKSGLNVNRREKETAGANLNPCPCAYQYISNIIRKCLKLSEDQNNWYSDKLEIS